MAAEPVAQPDSGVQLAVREQAGGSLAGDLYVARTADEPEAVEVGITLVPRFHGRGLAIRAITTISEALLELDGVERVLASIDNENTASQALFQRVGFRLISTEVGSFTRRDGSVGDELVFALVRSG